MTPGYWEDPEQTAATIDAEGWLHTGDIGIMNDRDYVKITDRKKDMFIVGGFNAYPAEIENMLLGYEQDRAGRGGRRSPTRGSARSGARSSSRAPASSSTPDDVIAWSREHMANFKVPRAVEIVERAAVQRRAARW